MLRCGCCNSIREGIKIPDQTAASQRAYSHSGPAVPLSETLYSHCSSDVNEIEIKWNPCTEFLGKSSVFVEKIIF